MLFLHLRSAGAGVMLAAAATIALAAGVEPHRGALRELTTDRPDATESPFTIEPGHMQVEMDFFAYRRDPIEEGMRQREWSFAPVTLRVGVTRQSELGILIRPFVRETATDSSGARVTRSGHDDIGLRAKLNFGGNDGGQFAWGLIADLRVPSGSRELTKKKYEGGLTFPFAFELGNGWTGGAMTRMEVIYGADGRARAVTTNSFTTAHSLRGKTNVFLELISTAGDGSHVFGFNGGLARAVGRDTQFDCGVSVGISRAAPPVAFFSGMSRRF